MRAATSASLRLVGCCQTACASGCLGSWDFHRCLQKAANELRSGDVVELAGGLMEVVKVHYAQGAGRAHGLVSVDARDLSTGQKRTERLRPSQTLEQVFLTDRAYKVLYTEPGIVHLMDTTTWESVAVGAGLFQDKQAFAVEGQDVTLEMLGDVPVRGKVPLLMSFRVASSPPLHRGSTGVQPKQVVLENGTRVSVPGHINAGDVVTIRTEDATFVKKVTATE